ncbi:MAG: SIS domain-containing protein [Chitinophagales bacterium]|nr:SIS domain-containing protein [Chitinophagales bacterium]
MEIAQFVKEYNTQFVNALEQTAVSNQNGTSILLENAVAAIVAQLQALQQHNRKLMLVGNGGSAGITSHMALDFWKNGKVKATAFNDASLLTAIANDYSYPEVFAKPIETFAEAGDMLFAISASGNSPNILNAAKAAIERNCTVVTFSGFSQENKLRGLGDFNFYVPAFSYGLVETLHAHLIHLLLDAKMRCADNIDVFQKNTPLP